MYCQHFNLKKKPFQISSDNDFLWLGKAHGTALDLLKKGMEQDHSLLVLTGDIGTGKTTLVNEIIKTLDKRTRYVKIEDPGFELHALFQVIAQAFGFEKQYNGQEKFSSGVLSFLRRMETEGKKVLVIVDESQRIPKRFLREMVSWSQFGLNHVLTVLLAGQLELLEVLRLYLGREWPDHIHVQTSLGPLDLEETRAYISKRLSIAGTDRPIFLDTAVQEVHRYSKGIPRVINISCDQALIQAFADDKDTIDGPTVQKAVLSLELPLTGGRERPPDVQNQQDTGREDPDREMEFLESHPPKKTRGGKRIAAGLAAACICLFMGYRFYWGPVFAVKQEKTGSVLSGPGPEPESIEQGKIKEIKSIDLQVIKNSKTPEPEIKDSVPAVNVLSLPSPSGITDKKGTGLGYTPEDEVSRLDPDPVKAENRTWIEDPAGEASTSESSGPSPGEGIQPILSDPLERESEAPRDIDSFVRKVFLSEEKKSVFMGSIVPPPEHDFPEGQGLEPGDSSEQKKGADPLVETENRGQDSGLESGLEPEPSGPKSEPFDPKSESSGPKPEPDAIIDWLLKKRAAGK
ncbi:ExeA family protein [Desulfospira joergensenii]|uniref:ExeA family protein n=1 Tax=Desulfospira joergensenii TaxID=53329 RepID=UPI0003B50703|nr:ATPase, T2SS/T4P/T4SS family [Desulfospira joergensenii]